MGVIFSGIQPTGNLHLGNYLGAIKNWVAMQHEYKCLFGIMDLHAITVPQDPEKLRAAVLETTAALVACGIDPEKNIIVAQSTVPQHAELSWVLGCLTPLGWLNRMTQFKEKAKAAEWYIDEYLKNPNSAEDFFNESFKGSKDLKEQMSLVAIRLAKKALQEAMSSYDKAKLGLYGYPVLMAADVLLYKTTHVPVGEDQKQHIELARDIAGAFNRQYNVEFFPQPEPVIQKQAARVMSLKDGTKKMSKSDSSEYSRINLTDTADQIADKMKRATTDSIQGVSYDEENRPHVSNLVSIYSALTGETTEAIVATFANSGFAQFKQALADVAVEHLAPITSEMNRLMKDKGYITSLLAKGGEAAREIAQNTMDDVRKLVGLPVL